MYSFKGYHPIDPNKYTRFTGIRTFMRLPVVKDLKEKDIDFAIVGAPCDVGSTFRSGTNFGPSAIREMSPMLRLGNPNFDINIFDYLSGIDYGDSNIDPCSLESSHKMIEETFTRVVDAGIMPIGLGGDHSVTLPILRAVAKKHGPVALIQFDAHMDTDDEENGNRLTHGTQFRRAIEEGIVDPSHSVQVGIRGIYGAHTIKESKDLGYTVITAKYIHENGLDNVIKKINETVGDSKSYFTFDIDFFDPAYAPGTGTIEVGGFTSYQGLYLLRGLKYLHFVGFDVVEVLPAFDPTQITAYLAGNVIHDFIAMLAWQKRETLSL